MNKSELLWLAGLLEGEGSFLKGPPSAPNQPRITVQMTDLDVIEKVAKLFDVTYVAVSERNGHKPCYSVLVKGRFAVDLMKLLHPLMGIRRKAQIDNAISGYTNRGTGDNTRKLSDSDIINIALDEDNSVSALARQFSVSRTTIRKYRPNRSASFNGEAIRS